VLQNKLKEAAFRALMDGDLKLEAFAKEIMAEIAGRECEECGYLETDLDDEKKAREKAENRVEELEAEIQRADDACYDLNGKIDELMEEIAELKSSR